MPQQPTLNDPLPTRIRIRFGDGIPIISEAYRKCWLPLSADWRTIGDLVAAAESRLLITSIELSKKLHAFVKGYAVLPEERLRGFIHPDDILELRSGFSRSENKMTWIAEAPEEPVKHDHVKPVLDPSVNCSGTPVDTCRPTKKRRQKRKRSENNYVAAESALLCDKSVVETPLVTSEEIDVGSDEPVIRMKSVSTVSLHPSEKFIPSKRHIRFDGLPTPTASISGNSALLGTGNNSESASIDSIASPPPVQSCKNTPTWIANRLSPSRKNMLADLNPQELSESDDGEDYNAALMGQEHSDKQDFRKKSYSVISSVQRLKPIEQEADEATRFQELRTDVMLQTGDVILFKKIELCEETWQVTVSDYLKALVGCVSVPLNKKVYDLELHLFDDDGQIVGNSIRISVGSMTSIRLISGPTVSTLSEMNITGVSTDSSVLDCFRQELQSKRLRLP